MKSPGIVKLPPNNFTNFNTTGAPTPIRDSYAYVYTHCRLQDRHEKKKKRKKHFTPPVHFVETDQEEKKSTAVSRKNT